MQIKNMLRAIIFLYVLLISNGMMGQNIVLKGRIVDAETNKPVEFANIGVKGTYMGTASDFDGAYELIVGEDYSNYAVQISAVGYKVKEMTVADMQALIDHDLKLFPQTYGIQQVEVKADSKRLYGIIKGASNLIKDNYVGSYAADVYMMQQIGANKKTEMAIAYEDHSGYGDRTLSSAVEKRNFKVNELRRNFTSKPIKEGMVLANDILEFDIVRQRGNVLDKDFVDTYNLSLSSEEVVGGDSAWVIRYVLDEPTVSTTGDAYCTKYEGWITIRQSDYAIVRNELHYTSGRPFHAGRSAYKENAKGGEYKCKVVTNYKALKSGKYALSKVEFLGAGEGVTQNMDWIVYKSSETKGEMNKREYYSTKADNADFWKRFTIPQ